MKVGYIVYSGSLSGGVGCCTSRVRLVVAGPVALVGSECGVLYAVLAKGWFTARALLHALTTILPDYTHV